MYHRIRDLREDKDLNQEQLAKLLNVSQTTYSRYESGKLDIPTQSMIKLADFYSTSVDYLLNLTDHQKLREDNDLTQHQIATLLNISQSTYSRYENGELDIPIQMLIKLANYYDTSIDYLVNMTDVRTSYKASEH